MQTYGYQDNDFKINNIHKNVPISRDWENYATPASILETGSTQGFSAKRKKSFHKNFAKKIFAENAKIWQIKFSSKNIYYS